MSDAVKESPVRIRTRPCPEIEKAVEVQFFFGGTDEHPDMTQGLTRAEYIRKRLSPFAWREWVRRVASDGGYTVRPRWLPVSSRFVAFVVFGIVIGALWSPFAGGAAGPVFIASESDAVESWTRESIIEWASARKSHDGPNLVAIFRVSTREAVLEAIPPAVSWAVRREFDEAGQVRYPVLEARKFLYSLTVQEIEAEMGGATPRDLRKLERYLEFRRGIE